MELLSTAFEAGGHIPGKYTCDGDDLSPPLSWIDAPPQTKSFALICDDPDAPSGLWVHWVVFNVPGESRELAENLPPQTTLANGVHQGRNDFHKIGYGGPCPPRGEHRYFFQLYALDNKLELKSGASSRDVLKAMAGHILAESRLMAKYKRRQGG